MDTEETKCFVCGNDGVNLRKLHCNHELCSSCIANMVETASEVIAKADKRVLTFTCPFCRSQQVVPRIGFFGFELKQDDSAEDWQMIASNCSVCNVPLTQSLEQKNETTLQSSAKLSSEPESASNDELREFEATFDRSSGQLSFQVVSDSEPDTKLPNDDTLTMKSTLSQQHDQEAARASGSAEAPPENTKSATFCAECRKTLCADCALAHIRHVETHAYSLIVASPKVRLDPATLQQSLLLNRSDNPFNRPTPNFASLPVMSASLTTSVIGGNNDRRRNPATVACDVHTGKPIELYCRPCGAPLCQLCVLIATSPHRSHEIVELSCAEYEIRQQVKRFEDRVAKPNLATANSRVAQLDANLKLLSSSESYYESQAGVKLETSRQSIERSITDCVEQLRAKLDQAMRCMLSASERRCDQLQQTLENAASQARIDRDAAQLESLIVTSVVNSDCLADLARLGKQIQLVDARFSTAPRRNVFDQDGNANSSAADASFNVSSKMLLQNRSLATLRLSPKVTDTLELIDSLVASLIQEAQQAAVLQTVASLTVTKAKTNSDFDLAWTDATQRTGYSVNVRSISSWKVVSEGKTSNYFVFGLSDATIRFVPVDQSLKPCETPRSDAAFVGKIACHRGVPCALQQFDAQTLATIEYQADIGMFFLLVYSINPNWNRTVLLDAQVFASKYTVDCFLVRTDANTLLYAASFTKELRFVELTLSNGRCVMSSSLVSLAEVDAEGGNVVVPKIVDGWSLEPKPSNRLTTISSLAYVHSVRICAVLDAAARYIDVYSHSVGMNRVGSASMTKRTHQVMLVRRVNCDTLVPRNLIAVPDYGEPAMFILTASNGAAYEMHAFDALRGEHVGLVRVEEPLQKSSAESGAVDNESEDKDKDESASFGSVEQEQNVQLQSFTVPLCSWYPLEITDGGKQLCFIGWNNVLSGLECLKVQVSKAD